MPETIYLPCLDSDALAVQRKSELFMERAYASALGHAAVRISKDGFYINSKRGKIDIAALVEYAVKHKQSLPPDTVLPPSNRRYETTSIQVANETTLQAACRLLETSSKVLALNFANGVHPGGGFLHGALAQEECLCRSSALYLTLEADPMYKHHAARPQPDSTDWAIVSPSVPVFRSDDGRVLDAPYCLSFITCAAPYAPAVGVKESARLMHTRILRVLEIASACGYDALVLGAWGCGAFANNPLEVAQAFKTALTDAYAGAFKDILFAITDWSPHRRLLGAFRDVFKA